MKSRIVAFAVLAVLILMFWGLVSIPGSIYGMRPAPEREIVGGQVEPEVSSESRPANGEPAYYSEAGLFHFVDLNAVYAVEADDKTVQFVGREGTRVLDLATGEWSFTVRKYTGPDIYGSDYRWDLDTLKEKLPEWYERFPTCVDGHYYDQIWAHCRDGNQEYILVTNTWGGIVGEEDVIDVAGRKVYRMPYQDSRFMVVHNGSIWLGGERGIIRLDPASGQRWECVCPPRFREVAGWAEQGKVRFVTSREGDFMVFDVVTNAIELKSLPGGLVTEVFGPPGKGADISPYPLWFSNPVLAKGRVYIAAHDYRHAAVLLYDVARNTWDHIDLPSEIAGDIDLIQTGDTIWCASQHIYGDSEGTESDEFGGVVALVPGRAPKVYSTLLKVPIGGYRLSGETIQFLSAKAIDDLDSDPGTCYPGLMNDRSNQPEELREIDFCCTISLTTLQVLGYIPLDKVDDPGSFTHIGSPAIIGGDPSSTWWLVQPAMVEIPAQHVEILRAGEPGTT